MEQLIKQTGEGPSLSCYEKIAILLGELDAEAYDKVMAHLSFTTKQLRKIRKAMKKLGKYNPHDYRQSKKETTVLSELFDFFRRRNISTRKTFNTSSLKLNLTNAEQTDMKNVAISNPEDVANILKSWLKES